MTESKKQPETEITGERSTGTGLVLPAQALPDKLYIIPATNRPFFPAQVQPLLFSTTPWNVTLQKVAKSDQNTLGVCYLSHQFTEDDLSESLIKEFPKIGCAVQMHKLTEVEDKLQFIAVGMQRFCIVKWLSKTPPYLAQVKYLHTKERATDKADEVKAYAMALINTIKELLPLNPLYNEELRHYLNRFSPNDPSPLTDFAAAITTADGEALQEVLETIPLLKRMEKVLVLIRAELEVAKLQQEINQEVNNKIGKHQREFFLKEQLKIIQKELGFSKDDRTADQEEFEKRLEKLKVPEAQMKKIRDEMQKLAVLETGSPEYGVTRNYLDWATSVPWGLYSKDNFDLKHARKILDADHDSLEDVKDRIVEFLAVGAYKGEMIGSIVLLVGPPGVGKTSIGKSIAKALGRKYYRFSLGGMRDEAEIKGHRRTYIGAMPGKLVQALKDVQTANPVIMLDEIDKMGNSYQGDPASALLEVLDPAQNSEFLDHYLDMRIDLSKTLFICTANQLDSIPSPLLDRMDTIRLSGYLTAEKIEIARHHLWPKQLKVAGLTSETLKISKAALRQLVEGYAREAGVRQLDKLLNRLLRKALVKLLEKDQAITINTKDLLNYLGQPHFHKEKPLQGVGVITGLAWTALGGTTLPVEASVIHHQKSGFKLTGKLGDVMRESAEIAYSYIMAHQKDYHVSSHFFKDSFIHLHVPEGATPKDGPSAGITMASALLSLAKGKKIKFPFAMTGELTLTGQVLAVGGVREKIIAAKRVGLYKLIIPKSCQHDFDELPCYIKEGLDVHFVSHYKQVANLLFATDV